MSPIDSNTKARAELTSASALAIADWAKGLVTQHLSSRRAESDRLARGQGGEFVDGSAGNSQRYCDHFVDQEIGQDIQRAIAIQRRFLKIQGPFFGDEAILHAPIMAAAAAQSGGVPRIMDLAFLRW